MDFTGESQASEREPFEVWRRTGTGAGEVLVSRHRELHLAQLVKMRGGADYSIRCRPWPQPTRIELPGIWSSYAAPLGLLALMMAGAMAGYLIVTGGWR